MSDSYYEKNARHFAKETADLDVTTLYEPFLSLIPEGSHILDAGCGSGRDTKFFLERSFRVTAIDSSAEMVAIATELSGQSVLQLRFQEIEYHNVFDAVWACASLLHVPSGEMDDVLRRLTKSMKNGGLLYMSFKQGLEEGLRNGRLFNDYTNEKLIAQLAKHPELKVLNFWTTSDVRPERSGDVWLNALCLKEDKIQLG